MQPLVTIGIPTYNRPEGLRRALASVAKQDYSNLEIIISDNASPGKATMNIALDFCRQRKGIYYHQQKENLGPAKNFSWLLEKASGTHFMWLSDDDEYAEDGLVTALVNKFRADLSARFVFPDVTVFFDDMRTHGIKDLHSSQFARCVTDEDYLNAWCTFGGGHSFYGMYQLDYLKQMAVGNLFHSTLSYYNEGMFLHKMFLNGGARFVSGVTLIYNGKNSSLSIPPKKLLSSFLIYSASVHWLYLRAHLPLLRKAALLRRIGKSHFPYIITLLRDTCRNTVDKGQERQI